jgi:hypothetical protein
MGSSLIERLFAEGVLTDGDFLRILGGLDPDAKTKALSLDHNGNLNIVPSSGSQTLYNQFRVATLENVFDVRQQFEKDSIYMVESLTGGATSVFLPNEAAVRLRLTTASGDKAIRQSRPYIPYQIGRSQLIFIHAVMGASKANVRQRLGYFDDSDGAFFQQTGSGISVVRRSHTSGSPVDTAVAQASWNIDPLDGTGPSGVTLDTSKFQIFAITLSWGGEVRMGMLIGGENIDVHRFDNSNFDSTIWSAMGSLPVRHEIENTAASASDTDLKQFALAVFSEGSIDQLGLLTSTDIGNSTRSIGAGASLPVLSIRLKSTHNRGIIVMNAFGASQTSVKNMRYQLIVGGVLTGASYASVSPAVERDFAATALTGGRVLQAGYIPASAVGGGVTALASRASVWASSDFAGVSDILTLLVTNMDAGSMTALASIQWKEIA